MVVHSMSYNGGRKRWQLMEQACAMARSGKHADHTTIVAMLAISPDYSHARQQFRGPTFLGQLDRMCLEAHMPPPVASTSR